MFRKRKGADYLNHILDICDEDSDLKKYLRGKNACEERFLELLKTVGNDELQAVFRDLQGFYALLYTEGVNILYDEALNEGVDRTTTYYLRKIQASGHVTEIMRMLYEANGIYSFSERPKFTE